MLSSPHNTGTAAGNRHTYTYTHTHAHTKTHTQASLEWALLLPRYQLELKNDYVDPGEYAMPHTNEEHGY